MNIKLFKKLIKEAVVEAIYEELPDILNESLVRFSKKQQLTESVEEINFTSNDVLPKTNLPVDFRKELIEKMGGSFGFNKPPVNNLKVVNEVDPNTGRKKNPWEQFMKDTAVNLTPQDLSGLRNLE